MKESDKYVRQIFEKAIEIRESHERMKLVDSECAGDVQLRDQVLQLLEANADAGSFMEADADANETRSIVAELRNERECGDVNVGTVLGDRYELLENIGEGGMGSVWVAKQKEPVKRKVAIKLVKAGMDSKQVLARFESERQALAVMDHPNIAKIFDGGMTPQGRPFFVMEYVKGIPFTQYCDQARLSLRERLELFIPVCQAIQHAHHKGIVHRDLKPSNILICLYDGHPVPKVIDFGLAKALHHSLTDRSIYTAHGMMVGTPIYMSPEQAEFNNLDIDTRTDIYSLGVLLYEILTGTTPLERKQFEEAAFDEVLRIIREVEPARPSLRLSGSDSLPSIAAQRRIEPRDLQKTLSGELDWIVMKALDKERSRRYETANSLAMDVERYLDGDAIEARPPSSPYRMHKFVRKNRGLVASIIAIASMLLLAFAGTGYGLFQARFSAADAQNAARQAEDALTIAEIEKAKAKAATKEAEQQRKAVDAKNKELAHANKQLEKTLNQVQVARQDGSDIANFLTKQVLMLARPKKFGGLGENLTVQEAVLAASSKIDTFFEDRPYARMHLKLALGDFWHILEKDELAQLNWESALDVLAPRISVRSRERKIFTGVEKEIGETHLLYSDTPKSEQPPFDFMRRTVRGHVRRGLVFGDGNSRHEINLPKVNEANKFVKIIENPDNLDTIQSVRKRVSELSSVGSESQTELLAAQFRLGELFHNVGKIPEAIRIFEKLLPKTRDVFPYEHEAVAGTLWMLGAAHAQSANYSVAEKNLNFAITIFQNLEGFTGNRTIRCTKAVAWVYDQQGKTEKAIDLRRQIVDLLRLRVKDAETNSEVEGLVSSQEFLGVEQYAAGMYQDAISSFERVLNLKRGHFWGDEVSLLKTVRNLAAAHRKLGNPKEAIRLLEEAVKKAPASDPISDRVQEELRNSYLQARDSKFLSMYIIKELENARKDSDPMSVELSNRLAKIGWDLLEFGDFDKAEEVLTESLKIRTEKLPTDWRTFHAKSMLGAALLGQARGVKNEESAARKQLREEARELMIDGYNGLADRADQIPSQFREERLTEAIDRLIEYADADDDSKRRWNIEKRRWNKVKTNRNITENKDSELQN